MKTGSKIAETLTNAILRGDLHRKANPSKYTSDGFLKSPRVQKREAAIAKDAQAALDFLETSESPLREGQLRSPWHRKRP